MSAMLDMVGSFVIGGLLLMMILNVNTDFAIMSAEDRLELMIQENLDELVEEIEFDFRKIGYNAAAPHQAIQALDTSMITFMADLDNDSTLESVVYNLGPTSDVFGTVNPRDRILYRIVDGVSVGGSLGVVDFQLIFYDVTGGITTAPAAVKTIEYYLMLESTFPIDSAYVQSVWTGTIRPMNIQN